MWEVRPLPPGRAQQVSAICHAKSAACAMWQHLRERIIGACRKRLALPRRQPHGSTTMKTQHPAWRLLRLLSHCLASSQRRRQEPRLTADSAARPAYRLV